MSHGSNFQTRSKFFIRFMKCLKEKKPSIIVLFSSTYYYPFLAWELLQK